MKELSDELIDTCMKLAQGEHAQLKEMSEWAVAQMPKGTSTLDAVRILTKACIATAERVGVSVERLSSEVVPFYVALYDYGRSGRPHFSLAPDFFHAISLTDFSDDSDDPLPLPFPAFTVSFPQSEQYGGATKMLVCRLPKVDEVRGEIVPSWSHNRITLFTEDPVFSQWLVETPRKFIKAPDQLRDTPAHTREASEDEHAALGRARIMLANVLTYIEASGRLPTKRRAKGAAPTPVERLHDERPLFDVGRPVRLDGGIRRALLEGKPGESHARWAVAKRFIVRGHWRNQAYGEGYAERRRRWIEPFWKGPDITEAIERTYDVK